MRASKSATTVNRFDPLHSIANNSLYIGIVEDREGFMPRLEVEDTPVFAMEGAATAENLAATVVTDKDNFVRIGDTERFTIGFYVGQLKITVNTLGDGVRRINYPN